MSRLYGRGSLRSGAAILGIAALSVVMAGCVRTVSPTVSSTNPAGGATSVAVNSQVTATFSEEMDPATITDATFTLMRGSIVVAGTVAYDGVTAMLDPITNLLPNTLYTATITTDAGAREKSVKHFDDPGRHAWVPGVLAGIFLAGNLDFSPADSTLAEDFVWSFTTGAGLDIVAPGVSSTTPANNATGIAFDANISATFSEAMNPLTINTTTIILENGENSVSGAVTYAGVTATFNPAGILIPFTQYTATIRNEATDLAGNPVVNDFVWSFTTGLVPDTTDPTVSSTAPTDNATQVSIDGDLAATFSEAMNPLTVSTSTFTLRNGILPVAGSVNYSGVTATFNPTATLLPGTLYTATISMQATDLAGNPLPADYVWTFTTGGVSDTTAPTVSFTSPANGEAVVPLGRTIAATFSEVMDPMTLTTATFTVATSGNAVSGTVTYIGFTALFNPNSTLAGNTLYTATITTVATDLAGNGLTSNYSWNFVTGAAIDTTAPRVSFTFPSNGETGVLLGRTLSATFTEVMDPATITAATFTLESPAAQVPGTVSYAGLTAIFNPTSTLEPTTLYTATINTGATDLAGNALLNDFVWSFTTGVEIDTTPPTVSFTFPEDESTNVLLGQNLVATFSEVMSPNSITTSTFTLDSGVTPIFGTVTYVGLNAVFNPSSPLTSLTEYTATISTGAKDLAGNALADDYVWTFTTGEFGDTTAPRVSATLPVDGATNVPLRRSIAATFSEAMDPSTITTATFTLDDGITLVTGTVTYVGLTAIFNPTNTLAADTEYTATITIESTDLAGNTLDDDYLWSFTTGADPDDTAPLVSVTFPANGATNVPLSSNFSATFTEAMDPAKITNATFRLNRGATAVAGTVVYAGITAIFNPTSALLVDTVYTATIATGAADLAGNALASNYVWTFTTGAGLDSTAPEVTFTAPANGATDVPLSGNLAATFSEAMNPLTINTSTFTLDRGTTPVAGSVVYAGTTAIFNPNSTLLAGTVYTATITNAATDLNGNRLDGDFVWTFTTGNGLDNTAPTVLSTDPQDDAVDVPVTQQLAVTFNEVMDPLTVNTTTFILLQGAEIIPGTVVLAGATAIFSPLLPLSPDTIYSAAVLMEATDLAGNALASDEVWTFTTVVTPTQPL